MRTATKVINFVAPQQLWGMPIKRLIPWLEEAVYKTVMVKITSRMTTGAETPQELDSLPHTSPPLAAVEEELETLTMRTGMAGIGILAVLHSVGANCLSLPLLLPHQRKRATSNSSSSGEWSKARVETARAEKDSYAAALSRALADERRSVVELQHCTVQALR